MERRAREQRRLRQMYARRRTSGVEDRYAPYTPANLYRLQRLERDLTALMLREGLLPWGERRALDLGCGGGWWLRTLLRWGARPEQLTGLDALPEATTAAQTVHPALAIVQGAADSLPFPASAFDLVSQFTVFSSILDRGVRRAAAAEIGRVLRPGGVALWYDFTVNPTNRETRGLGLDEVRRLFPGWALTVRRVTLAPPLTRLLAPRARLAAELLETLPPLRTHLLVAARRPVSERATVER
jgi:SAM-dependent methyltransferase